MDESDWNHQIINPYVQIWEIWRHSLLCWTQIENLGLGCFNLLGKQTKSIDFKVCTTHPLVGNRELSLAANFSSQLWHGLVTDSYWLITHRLSLIWYISSMVYISYLQVKTTQQTWSGFSPTTVPDNNRQSGLSPTTVPEMSTGSASFTDLELTPKRRVPI